MGSITGGRFDKLERAKITFNYLQSNSTTHEHPFSALAELVDNAYDARAMECRIGFEEKRGEPYLEVQDDGCGMTHADVVNAIAFGYSDKRTIREGGNDLIGRYGNGLKSGAIHLGRELMLITKKDKVFTVLFISHAFHEDNNLEDAVFVPCPSFDSNGDPIYENDAEKERFDQEMAVIEKYSPFDRRALQDIFESKLSKPSGTYITISGLARTLIGELTFITSDPFDLQLDNDALEPWQASLREYLSRLYLEANMRIFLRGKEVRPKKVVDHWMARASQNFTSNQFNAAQRSDLGQLEQNLDRLRRDQSDMASRVGQMNADYVLVSSKEARMEQRQIRMKHEQCIEAVNAEEKRKAEAVKSSKLPQTFFLHFGVNVVNRDDYGINLYLNKRLIVGGYKNIPFYKNGKNIGVSLYLDMNYKLFHPTNNKQGFDNARDFNSLIKKCSIYLDKYKDYLEVFWIPNFLKGQGKTTPFEREESYRKFWEFLEYPKWNQLTSVQRELSEEKRDLIAKECGVWEVCQQCRGWRRIDNPKNISYNPGTFRCQDLERECQARRRSDKEQFDQIPSVLISPFGAHSASSRDNLQASIKPEPPRRSLEAVQPPSTREKAPPVESSIEMRRVKAEFDPEMMEVDHAGLDDLPSHVDHEPSTSDAVDTSSPRPRRSGRSHHLEPINFDEEPPIEPIPEQRAKQRPVAKKPATKIIRRRPVTSDEEEEVVQPTKKNKKNPVAVSDEKWLRNVVDQFLEALDQPPLPRNGERELNPKLLVNEFVKKKSELKTNAMLNRMKKIKDQVTIVLDTVENKGNSSTTSGNDAGTFQRLDAFVKAHQANKKKK